VPTYENGTISADGQWFYTWLQECRFDFRVEKDYLKHISFGVFGLCDSAYGKSNLNVVARNIDSWMFGLGATRLVKCGKGDRSADVDSLFDGWVQKLSETLLILNGLNGEADEKKVVAVESVVDDEEYLSNSEEEVENEDKTNDKENQSQKNLLDLEDLGKMAPSLKAAKKPALKIVTSMVNPSLEKSLTKQGYKIVGSHSGVKVCRWTKAMLRGRGGCYKHTFYGIASHQCMETTPSLACANKCVFCWRHHTNPVGTSWKWKMDEPEVIVEGALNNHYQMIKQLKGVPGVLPERFQEGMNVKHCALSLVGEPIMYPKINEFLDLLHDKGISSFLVTNAQFPMEIRNLRPVTQLYVSVDAPTKESLKKIDRPLFSDYWERFNACLDALREKKQRTVYRMTLVKGFNVDDIELYAELIKRGQPDFVEVKGVTFCGYSGKEALTMKNVPFQEEVVDFVQKLVEYLGHEYEISCEHAHSCSLLISHTKFKIKGKWHTWIDYEKFQELVREGKPFTSMDYIAPTPLWAVFGADEKGFDPAETRFHRKQKLQNEQ
jgi:tRNA wybutosine-synthesizing protein 1